MAWVPELIAQGCGVDEVLPREEAGHIGMLLAQGKAAEAAPLIAAAFAGFEKLVAGREFVKGVGEISGRVVLADGKPAPGAHVRLFGTPYSLTTDEEGAFRFADVPILSARYILCASKPGYLDARIGRLAATADGGPPVELRLVPLTERNAWHREKLAVKAGYLIEMKAAAAPTPPADPRAPWPGGTGGFSDPPHLTLRTPLPTRGDTYRG